VENPLSISRKAHKPIIIPIHIPAYNDTQRVLQVRSRDHPIPFTSLRKWLKSYLSLKLSGVQKDVLLPGPGNLMISERSWNRLQGISLRCMACTRSCQGMWLFLAIL
jgi:hypothetical protein